MLEDVKPDVMMAWNKPKLVACLIVSWCCV